MDVIKHLVFRSCLLLALILVLVSLTWAATPKCQNGYTLIGNGSKCVKEVTPTCPTGYTWEHNKCKPRGSSPHCPNGTNVTEVTKKCVSYLEPTISCPSNSQYYSPSKKCRKMEDPSCLSGYKWNSSDKSCIPTSGESPICPTGSRYSSQKKTCEQFSTPYCDAGYMLTRGQCIRSTGMPSGKPIRPQ